MQIFTEGSTKPMESSHFFHRFLCTVLVLPLLGLSDLACAQNFTLNGIAAFGDARSEQFIGALYLGWPSASPEEIITMPGRKHMHVRVSAPWPRLQFAKQWNQWITANNSAETISENAADIMAFFAAIKSDLARGDQLVVALDDKNTTQVFLNGVSLQHTDNPGLFNMLLNVWIGQKPPSDAFRADMLQIDKKDLASLNTRFGALKPAIARAQEIARWQSGADSARMAAAVPAAAAPALAVNPTASSTPSPKPAEAPPTPAPVDEMPRRDDVRRNAIARIERPALADTVARVPKTPRAIVSPPPSSPPSEASVAPSRPAVTQPSAASAIDPAQQQLSDDYRQFVRSRITKNVAYPRRAARNGQEGLVMLNLMIDRSGNIAKLDIVQSGEPALDEAAERAARLAAPFPPPSAELGDAEFSIAIPIVFKLN